MPILNIEHDFGHAIEADPNWSESYYFNGYAPAPRVGFFARIAIRPNEPHADGFICVWLPDGTQVRLSAACANDIPDPGQPTLEGIRFERLMPMQVWRLVGDGRAEDGRGVAIDVTFQALAGHRYRCHQASLRGREQHGSTVACERTFRTSGALGRRGVDVTPSEARTYMLAYRRGSKLTS